MAYILETINELTLKATCTGSGVLYTKAGAMIGYQGECKFDKVLLGPQGNPLQALLGQIGRRLTGENIPLMKVTSSTGSESYYANLERHVTVVDLSAGDSISVESEDLLAFTDSCDYSFRFIGKGIISQKGFFTSSMKGRGRDAYVAILTTGNPIVLNTPCKCDPDAIVGWTGPDPDLKLDVSWKNLIGQASGESYMFDFTVPGYQVILQPYERSNSGLNIAID